MTALSLAARGGHPSICQNLLSRRASPNRADNLGFTPLAWALAMGHIDCVRTLANHGVIAVCAKLELHRLIAPSDTRSGAVRTDVRKTNVDALGRPFPGCGDGGIEAALVPTELLSPGALYPLSAVVHARDKDCMKQDNAERITENRRGKFVQGLSQITLPASF